MDRLETIRDIVDQIMNDIHEQTTRKYAYIHTYGVSQSCALFAKRRKIDVELASIAGMLHDIALYVENCTHQEHAKRSSILAKLILEHTDAFDEKEVLTITNAIALHSNKMERDGSKISELLKDADVLQHYLYNPKIEPSEKDKYRLFYILEELDMN